MALRLLLLGSMVLALLPLEAHAAARGANWIVEAYFPRSNFAPGDEFTLTVTIRKSAVDAILQPDTYVEVHDVVVWATLREEKPLAARLDQGLSGGIRRINYRGDVSVRILIPDLEPGRYDLEIRVMGRELRGNEVLRGSSTLARISTTTDSMLIGVLGTRRELTGCCVMKVSFPVVARQGEVLGGEIRIVSFSTWEFDVYTLLLRYGPDLQSSEPLFTGGVVPTLHSWATDFDIAVPSDAQPGEWYWIAQAELLVDKAGIPTFENPPIPTSLAVSGWFYVEEAPDDSDGGFGDLFGDDDGCVIATAAFGSEMDANVEAMRSLRDEMVMTTFTGSNFMRAFNAWYYSWSPPVADVIRANEVLRQATRLVLYPVVASVGAAEEAYSLLSFNEELAATASILTAASISGAFYIAPLILALGFISERLRPRNPSQAWRHRNRLFLLSLLAASALTLLGGAIHSSELNSIGVTALALTVTLSVALLTVEAVTGACERVVTFLLHKS